MSYLVFTTIYEVCIMIMNNVIAIIIRRRHSHGHMIDHSIVYCTVHVVYARGRKVKLRATVY